MPKRLIAVKFPLKAFPALLLSWSQASILQTLFNSIKSGRKLFLTYREDSKYYLVLSLLFLP